MTFPLGLLLRAEPPTPNEVRPGPARPFLRHRSRTNLSQVKPSPTVSVGRFHCSCEPEHRASMRFSGFSSDGFHLASRFPGALARDGGIAGGRERYAHPSTFERFGLAEKADVRSRNAHRLCDTVEGNAFFVQAAVDHGGGT